MKISIIFSLNSQMDIRPITFVNLIIMFNTCKRNYLKIYQRISIMLFSKNAVKEDCCKRILFINLIKIDINNLIVKCLSNNKYSYSR